ncbi:hypothetical protein B0J13DRAFT_530773 [Dactylonectria estremocensis]|uniref:Uncharacterized protein n=1 Tax=Dactylonectria estremocensis TaxID=1079267 RepID=A0A9P9DXD9_9HYPO|nr:hypothetical protein B0J13DRAFT_530773 [Dactylonectria estremocensis]
METYPSSISGPLLFTIFVMCICVWWASFAFVESSLRKFCPALYHRLNTESRTKKLFPFIMMSMRVALGVLVTFPTCAYGAIFTPWGFGHKLDHVGGICVATQATVWATELSMMREYSPELFVHHIVCLLVLANVVLSPPIHQLKLLYILFATQLGDLGAGSVAVLKLIGKRPASSKTLYGVVLVSTTWLASSKTSTGFWAVGNSLQSPYRGGDWIWTFCLLFWAFYSLFGAYRNLKWLGVIKSNPLRPYSLVLFNRVNLPISHILLGGAFGVSLLSTIFMYGMNHTQTLTSSDLTTLSALGLLGVSLGLTSAMGMRVMYPVKASLTDPWGRDLYLHYGMLIVAWWSYSATQSEPTIDRSTMMSALALNVPIFQTIAKVSYSYSVRDAATHFMPPHHKDEDEKPIPVAPAMAKISKTAIKAHIGMARANLTIFLIAVALLACNVMDLPEAGTLALGASLVSQLMRSPGMIYDSLNESAVAPFLHALLTSIGIVIELSILVYQLAARQMSVGRTLLSSVVYDYALIGVTIAAGFASEYLLADKTKPSKPKQNPTTSKESTALETRPKKGGLISPMVFSVSCAALAQGLMAYEVITYSGPQVLPEPGIAFTNFRGILTSPQAWMAAVLSTCLPIFLLKVLDFDSIRSTEEDNEDPDEDPVAAAERRRLVLEELAASPI